MAKKRKRKTNSQHHEQPVEFDEKSKKFVMLLAGIGLVLLIAFIALEFAN